VAGAAAGLLATALALAVVVPLDVWVYLEALRGDRAGRPVRLVLGAAAIDRPEQWLAGCVVLFAAFFPAYLVARRGE
jgi:hypothetical protein